jgi:hypothetical protein
LLAHGLWFSPGTLASSTTKTGCHDEAEILLKVTFNTINQIKIKILALAAASRVHPFFVIYKAGRKPTPYW